MAPARSPLSKTDSLLRPGLTPEGFTCGNRTHDFYRAPYPSEGPVKATDRTGRRSWMYMYAHFVFSWTEGASTVHVSHGTLNGPKITLWTDIRIAGCWSGTVLADFGRDWVIKHLAKFAN
ncbi:hypothetical protein GCM10027258_52710 [Amycolatopsis stemonae]